jgi:P21-Rho-binding domain
VKVQLERRSQSAGLLFLCTAALLHCCTFPLDQISQKLELASACKIFSAEGVKPEHRKREVALNHTSASCCSLQHNFSHDSTPNTMDQQPPSTTTSSSISATRSRFRFLSSSKSNQDTISPLSAYRPSLRKPQSATSLQRHPSAPVLPHPRLHTPLTNRESPSNFRTKPNAYGSSNSSISIDQISAGPSPVQPGSDSSLPTSPPPFADSQHSQQSHPSASSQSSKDDLTRVPSEKFGISKSFTFDSRNLSAPDRPSAPPLHHTHTSPEPRGVQLLRSSTTNDSIMEVTPPRSDNGTTSPKRYSDDSSSSKPSISGRRKTGFSSFMNSMLGSPRNIKISSPENPIHMIHVGYDNVTGQFTVSLHFVLPSSRMILLQFSLSSHLCVSSILVKAFGQIL